MNAPLDPAGVFGGVRVIENALLEQDGEPYTVRRTWRERLFGRPWRPFVSTRVVVPRVPYRGALQLDARTFVMHPATLRELRAMTDAASAAYRHRSQEGDRRG